MRASRGTRTRRTLIVAVSAITLLAACGGDDGGSADDTSSDSTTAEVTTPGATTPEGTTPEGTSPDTTTGESDNGTVAPGEGVRGGEMTVGMIFDAFGLDPATVVGQSSDAHLTNAFYDNLMTYSPEGEPVGWLAESMTTTDQQHWTIKLRPNVTFHDGTVFDGEAVKFNLERHKDPALKSRNFGNAQNITTVTVVDPLTVELELAFPWAAFDEIMIGNLGLMASPTSIQAGTNNEKPVGTGPFKFVERIPGDRVVVERNENYWRTGEPYLDKITYRVMLDDAVRLSSVETGEIQAAQSVDASELADPKDGTKGTASPGRANTIHINTVEGPTADVRVRQALAQAIDYDALNDVIFDGAAPAQHHFIGESNKYFDASVEFPTYDLDGAKALVEEYEAENGPISVSFRCYTGPVFIQMTQLVTQMWTAAGIDVKLEMSDQGTLVKDMLSGNFQIGCLATNAETVDPDLLFYNAFHTGTSGNYGKYTNPEMDAALEEGRSANDEATRMAAYKTVQELLARDIPTIVWTSSTGGWVVGDDVEGLVALPGTEFHPSTVFIDG